MPVIRVAVTNGVIVKVRDRLLIEDCVDYINCEVEFRTSNWDRYDKFVLFARGQVTPIVGDPKIIKVPLGEDNTCLVPPEVSAHGGMFSVSLCGEYGDKVFTTNWLYFKMGLGSFIFDDVVPPNKSEWDLVYSAIGEKVDKTTTIAGIDLFDSISENELSAAFDLYIVNLEYNNNKWSKDKSFAEIKKAIEDKKAVVGLYNGKEYLCIEYNEKQIKFSNANTPNLITLTIDNNDTIMYEEIDYKKNNEITNEEMLNIWNGIMK